MLELTEDQHTMLREYSQLLNTVSEGFEYLENQIEETASPQAQQVFQDLLLAFEQVSISHEQMIVLFEEKAEISTLAEDFHNIVKLLQQWFELEGNLEKRQLLVEQVVPAYEQWKSQMQAFVKPYIAH